MMIGLSYNENDDISTFPVISNLSTSKTAKTNNLVTNGRDTGVLLAELSSSAYSIMINDQ